jgi:hypothetical protein
MLLSQRRLLRRQEKQEVGARRPVVGVDIIVDTGRYLGRSIGKEIGKENCLLVGSCLMNEHRSLQRVCGGFLSDFGTCGVCASLLIDSLGGLY